MNGLVRTMMVVLAVLNWVGYASAQSCPPYGGGSCSSATCATGTCATGACATGACATGTCGRGPLACAGCGACRDNGNGALFDRCWMERYGNLAQRSVNRAFAPQVLNGHVLDQTVWNHHFESGSATLTPGGLAHLRYLARRRPEPDRVLYLATANDLPYDPAAPDRYCGAKQELDSLRAAAIQKFLVGNNCGRCQDYQVLVHDPSDVSLSSVGIGNSVTQMYLRFRGGLTTTAGAGGSSGR